MAKKAYNQEGRDKINNDLENYKKIFSKK